MESPLPSFPSVKKSNFPRNLAPDFGQYTCEQAQPRQKHPYEPATEDNQEPKTEEQGPRPRLEAAQRRQGWRNRKPDSNKSHTGIKCTNVMPGARRV